MAVPATTEGIKGATVYTDEGVCDPRVALATKLVRHAKGDDIRPLIESILSSGSDVFIRDLAIMTFQARDVRGGKGERDLFIQLFSAIYAWNAELAESLMDLIPEYGSWKDVFTLADNNTLMAVPLMRLVKSQLEKDEAALDASADASISLLAKWAPREGKKYDYLVKKLARFVWNRPPLPSMHSKVMAAYRRRLARLNAHLKTVETFECAGRWDEIDPARVPGRAREIKKSAYLNLKLPKERTMTDELRYPNDEKRMICRQHFIDHFAAAAAGQVKLTGLDALYPHEIVKKAYNLRGKATREEMDALNATWTQMVEKVRAGGGLGQSVIMCDFSGSMQSNMGKTGDTPYWVSMAMGIMGAELCAEPFKGRFLSFDSEPRWIDLRGGASGASEANTLFKKLDLLHSKLEMCQGLSTDFQRAADLILRELVDSRASPGSGPKNLIVVTDMGFDDATRSDSSASKKNDYKYVVKQGAEQTHSQMIRSAFQRMSYLVHGDLAAWPAPRIVIWNVAASYSSDHQAAANEVGVLTLSGWSPAVFKVLCEEGPHAITPLEGLRMQLDDPRYEAVRRRVDLWRNGGWRGIF